MYRRSRTISPFKRCAYQILAPSRRKREMVKQRDGQVPVIYAKCRLFPLYIIYMELEECG